MAEENMTPREIQREQMLDIEYALERRAEKALRVIEIEAQGSNPTAALKEAVEKFLTYYVTTMLQAKPDDIVGGPPKPDDTPGGMESKHGE